MTCTPAARTCASRSRTSGSTASHRWWPINAFPDDHESEHRAISEIAEEMGARVAVAHHFGKGGAGATELAEVVAEAADGDVELRVPLPRRRVAAGEDRDVATKVYGADGVDYDYTAGQQLDTYEQAGFGHLPVCIAKTHLSISSDPTLKGAPTGWRLPVREVRASVGAGFVYPICGDMMTMPGLGSAPAALSIDIDENGEIVGLS